jgi:cytochrome c oxidase subunit 3
MDNRDERPALLEENPLLAYGSAKLGIWAFLATEVLLFGGLFTAYTVFRLKYPELFHEQHQHLNKIFGAVNTVVLICSSLSVAIGIAAIRRGRQELLKRCLMITIALGLTFMGIKFFEYLEHIQRGEYPSTNLFFSLYYTMTGLHGLHVLAGISVLTVMFVLAGRGKFTEGYNTPIEIVGIYWHFVDLVWIYLFPLLYLIG